MKPGLAQDGAQCVCLHRALGNHGSDLGKFQSLAVEKTEERVLLQGVAGVVSTIRGVGDQSCAECAAPGFEFTNIAVPLASFSQGI